MYYSDSCNFSSLSDTLLHKKLVPNEFKKQIVIALLNYPELKNTAIIFKVKKSKSPLSARPILASIFRRANKRKFVVCISSKTIKKFEPILLNNLSFNAQVSVLSHELAHISEFKNKKIGYFFVLALKHLSKKSIDSFEFNTDKKSIESGYGFQLLSWSKEVREKLNITNWAG